MKYICGYVALFCVVALNASTFIEDRVKELSFIKNHELLRFNLDAFSSDNIIEFDAFDQHYMVQLEANYNALPAVYRQTDDKTVSVQPPASTPCHFHGKVLNADQSFVTLSACEGRGIRGVVRAFGESLRIYPRKHFAHPTFKGHQLHDEHLCYRQSDYDHAAAAKYYGYPNKYHPQPHPQPMDVKRVNANGTANVRHPMQRRLLQDYADNVAEVYILMDPSYDDYYNGDTDEQKNWMLEIFNEADGDYADGDWGRYTDADSLRLKLVRLELVSSFSGIYRDLEFDGSYSGKSGSSGYRRQFRDWAGDNLDISGWDVGVLFTRDHDGHSGGGKAEIDSVCSDSKTSVYCGSNGGDERQRKVLSHEIGHAFGMQHDIEEECDPDEDPDKCLYNCPEGDIMGDGDENSGWSDCSYKYWRNWLELRDGASCLKPRTNPLELVIDDSGVSGGISPVEQPTKKPTARPTAGCVAGVKVSGLGDYSGTYEAIGTNEGQTAYYNDPYYLYAVEDDELWWVISRNQGDRSYSRGYCGPDLDLEDCSGEWSSSSDAEFNYCGDSSGSNPQPVTAPTPPPVSAPSGDCVRIEQMTGDLEDYNGAWEEYGTREGETVYRKDGYYLYAIDYEDELWWVIYSTLGSESDAAWNRGWCGPDLDILECDAQWDGDDGQASRAQFRSGCSAFELESASQSSCLSQAVAQHSDALCFNRDPTMSSKSDLNLDEQIVFEVDEQLQCLNNWPVYKSDVNGTSFYLHFYTDPSTSKWSISVDSLTDDGVFYCNGDDLLDCTGGRWNAFRSFGDAETFSLDASVWIEACGENQAGTAGVSGSGKSNAITIAVVLIVLLIGVAVLGALCWYKRKKMNFERVKSHVDQTETVKEESVEAQEEETQPAFRE